MRKSYVLIQMMEIMYGNRVYVFCSDDFKARQSIAGLETPVHCISILGVFYKLMKLGKEKSEMQEYYDRLAAFLLSVLFLLDFPDWGCLDPGIATAAGHSGDFVHT